MSRKRDFEVNHFEITMQKIYNSFHNYDRIISLNYTSKSYLLLYVIFFICELRIIKFDYKIIER